MTNLLLSEHRTLRRRVLVAAAVVVCVAQHPGVSAQPAPNVRVNRLIEALEAGQPGLSGVNYLFIDMEHGPFDLQRLEAVTATLKQVRNEKRQMVLAPIVRIPVEGDGDLRWVIKQVLELDALGIVVPHVETREQAMRAVRAMRYPAQRDSKYPEPRGLRGRENAQLWGLESAAEYLRKADVWPLNPEGELFLMVMIESQEGVKRVNELLDVPGVNVLFGPGDMAMALGVLNPPGGWHADVAAAGQTVVKACVAKKAVCFTLASSEADMQKKLAEGWKGFLGGFRTGAGSLRLELTN
jgi:4-hydroxy-2-oxoheptanedioate aldolase